MKPFGIGLALCLFLGPAAIAGPHPTVARPVARNQSKPIDQKNLVSFSMNGGGDLRWETIQVFPGGQVVMVVSENRYLFRRLTVASHVTPSQLARFFDLVNRADFPHLKRGYRNDTICDAGSTTDALTYVDRPGHQTTFSVYDYAGAAPLGFENLQRFLWDVSEAIVPPSRFDKESVSRIPTLRAPPPPPPPKALVPPPPPPRPLPPPPPPKPTAPER